MDPCIEHVSQKPLTTTFRNLSIRKDLLIENTFPVIPQLENCAAPPLCYKLSNAFKIDNANVFKVYLFSGASLILCVITGYQQWTELIEILVLLAAQEVLPTEVINNLFFFIITSKCLLIILRRLKAQYWDRGERTSAFLKTLRIFHRLCEGFLNSFRKIEILQGWYS